MPSVLRGSLRNPAPYCALLSLLLSFLPVSARGATLEQVLLFMGQGHARLLLVLDEPASNVTTHSSPAVGSAPARATVMLEGVVISPKLLASYRARPGGAEMPVDQEGIEQLVFSAVGQTAQVVVELERARSASISEVGDRAYLLDMRLPDRSPDDSLPGAQALASWLEGLSMVPGKAREPRSQPRIVVDAGHGGWDSGAVGCTGTHEADIVLALARRVALGLERELNAEVLLTREDDTFLSLQERAAFANAHDADLFISIHANAAPAPTVWGIETYYLDVASDANAAAVALRENASVPTGQQEDDLASRVISELVVSGTSALSRKLAHEIQGAVVGELTGLLGPQQIRNLGVKSAMFHVLVSTRMPSVLFEASFLTHPEEEMRLRTPAFQRAMAEAVVEGVRAYLEATEAQ
jgi:N-acetylmuramoyl-L-alanine amidase